jgi:hypothetical protein
LGGSPYADAGGCHSLSGWVSTLWHRKIWYMVGGCEILHHQKDGWNPIINAGMFTTYQLVIWISQPSTVWEIEMRWNWDFTLFYRQIYGWLKPECPAGLVQRILVLAISSHVCSQFSNWLGNSKCRSLAPLLGSPSEPPWRSLTKVQQQIFVRTPWRNVRNRHGQESQVRL